MRTFTEWFKVRIFEGVHTETDWVRALGNYVEQIIRNPKLDDIRTWVSLIQSKLSPQIRKNFMLDMISAIDKAIGRLPREDQNEAEKLVASIDNSIQVQNQMIARGYLATMEEPWKFYTSEQLEDYLAKSMETENPNLSIISKITKMNSDHWEELGDEFKDAFKHWYDDEYRKIQSRPSLSDVIKKQLQNPSEE